MTPITALKNMMVQKCVVVAIGRYDNQEQLHEQIDPRRVWFGHPSLARA